MEQSVIRHNRSNQDHFEVPGIFTTHKRSLRRLCFHTCLSVILFTGGSISVHAGYTPGAQPPRPGTPLGPPLPGPGTPNQAPPGSRQPPCTVYAVEIWSTSGWYASYWNAIMWLLNINNQGCQGVTRENQR